MNSIFKKFDALIEKIPPHIRDIIQKASMAMVALAALIAILMGITKGINEAKPSGFKLAKDTQELFYLEKLRNENRNKIRLKEDFDYEFDQMNNPAKMNEQYQKLSEDKLDHLPGESDDVLKKENPLKEKYSEREYLTDTPMNLPSAKPLPFSEKAEDILPAPEKKNSNLSSDLLLPSDENKTEKNSTNGREKKLEPDKEQNLLEKEETTSSSQNENTSSTNDEESDNNNNKSNENGNKTPNEIPFLD